MKNKWLLSKKNDRMKSIKIISTDFLTWIDQNVPGYMRVSFGHAQTVFHSQLLVCWWLKWLKHCRTLPSQILEKIVIFWVLFSFWLVYCPFLLTPSNYFSSLELERDWLIEFVRIVSKKYLECQFHGSINLKTTQEL